MTCIYCEKPNPVGEYAHAICSKEYDRRVRESICVYCGVERSAFGIVSCDICNNTKVKFQRYVETKDL